MSATPAPLGVRPLRVVFLVAPAALPLDVSGPHHIFSLGQKQDWDPPLPPCPGYRIEVLAMQPGANAVKRNGISLELDGDYRDLRGEVDTLLLVDGMHPWQPPAAFLRWLRARCSRARRVGAFCSGSLILAAAGLLDGRRATTHWHYCGDFARRFPQVRVESDPIYLQDGPFWTSAGMTAGMDLALALVEDDYGSALALRIAQVCVLFLRRPGGQSQFSAALSAGGSTRPALRQLPAWILQRLAEALPVERLARQAGMSPRNFGRTFRAEFGVAPARFVESLRLEAARRLLEDGRETIEAVASTTGFGTALSLRRAFLRTLRISPKNYRARFGPRQQAQALESEMA